MSKPRLNIAGDVLKTAAVIVLLVGVYGGAVWYPTMRQNRVLAEQVRGKQAELDAMKRPDLAPVRGEIAALRAELRDRSVDLPEGELHDRVLHHVSDTLLAQGITLYETSYGKTRAYKRFSMTPIEVTFEGRFPAAFRVIRQIENQGPPVRIDRLELMADERDPSRSLGVSMQLGSFFLPTEEQGGER